MKILILIGLLFSPMAFSHPLECFEAASEDRVIKFSDDLKAALCRKAKSVAPYTCFAQIYTNSTDYRISSTLAVQLCQGAEDASKVLECFNIVTKKFQSQVNNLGAAKLCSGATAPLEVAACFQKAVAKYNLTGTDAAQLCAH